MVCSSNTAEAQSKTNNHSPLSQTIEKSEAPGIGSAIKGPRLCKLGPGAVPWVRRTNSHCPLCVRTRVEGTEMHSSVLQMNATQGLVVPDPVQG